MIGNYSNIFYEKVRSCWKLELNSNQMRNFFNEYILIISKYIEYNEISIIKQYYKNVISKERKTIKNVKNVEFANIIDDKEIKNWIEKRWIRENTKLRSDETIESKINKLILIKDVRNYTTHKFPLYLNALEGNNNDDRLKEWSEELDDWYEKFLKLINITNLKEMFFELYYYNKENENETQDKKFIKEIRSMIKNSQSKEVEQFIEQGLKPNT